MYALYKKIPRGYSVEVEVIAVSTNKQILMNMLPHEVKKYLQSGNSRLEDWEIFKYFLPNGYKLRATDREVTFSLNIPWTLRKAGRDFRLICVTTNGQPVVLKDLDLNPETITVKTNKFYAFALVYKDTLPVK